MNKVKIAKQLLVLAKSLMARKQKYRDYTIEKSGENFYVTDPSGHRAFGEVPATVEMAKKWIDLDIYEKRSKHAVASSLVKLARELVSMEFDTEAEKKKYQQDHDVRPGTKLTVTKSEPAEKSSDSPKKPAEKQKKPAWLRGKNQRAQWEKSRKNLAEVYPETKELSDEVARDVITLHHQVGGLAEMAYRDGEINGQIMGYIKDTQKRLEDAGQGDLAASIADKRWSSFIDKENKTNAYKFQNNPKADPAVLDSPFKKQAPTAPVKPAGPKKIPQEVLDAIDDEVKSMDPKEFIDQGLVTEKELYPDGENGDMDTGLLGDIMDQYAKDNWDDLVKRHTPEE